MGILALFYFIIIIIIVVVIIIVMTGSRIYATRCAQMTNVTDMQQHTRGVGFCFDFR